MGAAFGLFTGYGWVFTILAFVVVGLIIYYYPQVEQQDWWLKLAMGMQMGGALGNVVDRLLRGVRHRRVAPRESGARGGRVVDRGGPVAAHDRGSGTGQAQGSRRDAAGGRGLSAGAATASLSASAAAMRPEYKCIWLRL